MKNSTGVLLLLVLLGNSACVLQQFGRYRPLKESSEKKSPTTLHDVHVRSTGKQVYRAAPDRVWDIVHTSLDVRFGWGLHECNGQADLTLRPYYYATDTLVLDARNMIFHEVELRDMKGHTLLYTLDYNKRRLKLHLEKKIQATDTLMLHLKYTAHPDESDAEGLSAIRDDKGLYFINADQYEPYKPQEIWTQGEPESNSNWFPTIDAPNEKFTIDLSITVNKELTTLSNGLRTASDIHGNLRTDHWVMKQPMPAYLVMMAVGPFVVTNDSLQEAGQQRIDVSRQDTLHLYRQDSLHTAFDSIVRHQETRTIPVMKDKLNGVGVSYYLEPDYAPYAKDLFGKTPAMIHFFSERLGVPYPWEKYAQVVVRDYVSGAMENTSATLHGESVQKNRRELLESPNDDIISHELFHQWFGDLVTCRAWSQLVLNEGFATLGEYLWKEQTGGRDALQEKTSQSLAAYLHYAKDLEDKPVIRYDYTQPDDMFSPVTYHKGGLLFNWLRAQLGDDAFFKALQNYLHTYAYGNAELEDLRKEMENISGRDLTLFFKQFFYQGGHPVLDIHYDLLDSAQLVQVIVEQKQNEENGWFQFPLDFQVIQGNHTEDFTFEIKHRVEKFLVKKPDHNVAGYPQVIVDPQGVFVGELNDHQPLLWALESYQLASDFIQKKRAINAFKALQANSDTAAHLLWMALADENPAIRLQVLEALNWNAAMLSPAHKLELSLLADEDSSARVREAVVHILAEHPDSTLLTKFSAWCHDAAYSVAAEALNGLYKLQPDAALQMAVSLDGDAKKDLLESIANIYAKSGTAEQLAFFKHYVTRLFGRSRAMLLEQYKTFCLRLGNMTYTNELTAVLKERAVKDDQPWVRFRAISLLDELDHAQAGNDPQKPSVLHREIQSYIDQEKNTDVLNWLKWKGLKSNSDREDEK